jgi:hypothetical protein
MYCKVGYRTTHAPIEEEIHGYTMKTFFDKIKYLTSDKNPRNIFKANGHCVFYVSQFC